MKYFKTYITLVYSAAFCLFFSIACLMAEEHVSMSLKDHKMHKYIYTSNDLMTMKIIEAEVRWVPTISFWAFEGLMMILMAWLFLLGVIKILQWFDPSTSTFIPRSI